MNGIWLKTPSNAPVCRWLLATHVLLASCATDPTEPLARSDGGDTVQPTRPTCEPPAVDAAASLPAGASATCDDGWWLNSGQACGPFGASCRNMGDGYCYRLCATSEDCPDPCAPACSGRPVYAGADTPSGEVPVCSPGVDRRYPAACESALRACSADCQSALNPSSCAMDCWRVARDCASSVCHPIFEACAEHCRDSNPENFDLANECVASCEKHESECRGG